LALGFLGEFGVLAVKKAVVFDFCYHCWRLMSFAVNA
jgi:hypothetical protein